MSKVVEIRKAITAFLKAKHPRIYFEVASEDAAFPYIVYDLPNSFGIDESTETFVLDIDGWDAPVNGDTTALEMLMDNIDMHGEVIITNGIGLKFYRENRISLRDDDKRIRRRKYVYQIRTFSGGE